MIAACERTWAEANQRYLSAALAEVRFILHKYIARTEGGEKAAGNEEQIKQAVTRALEEMPAPPALETLCSVFNLSSFERAVLLLCAGVELEGSFASLCAGSRVEGHRAYPTFSLALAAFPDAHWSALTPGAPLRYWRLIEVGKGSSLTTSHLTIDETILHYLAGGSQTDERLMWITSQVSPPESLVPSHERAAGRIVRAWADPHRSTRLPVIQLCGSDRSDICGIAAAACAMLGLRLSTLDACSLTGGSAELETVMRLLEREAILTGSALLVDCHDMDEHETARHNLKRVAERWGGGLILSCRERIRIQRSSVVFDIAKPLRREQKTLWQNKGCDELGDIECLVSQYDLSARTINEITESFSCASSDNRCSGLWDACRLRTRPSLDGLAQRIEPAVIWDDLVLPEQQKQILREIAGHVRRRSKVYGEWGFGARSSKGLGISALFEGASGTGKTMAGEALAKELRLDLYRIDLSSTVSKYIGETEKNLRRIFDAAEEGGAILLFDEADALFGKRSDIKDSHDRYANIEVSYLLQRMESYRGLAILTTNMKSALDSAFLRRIRFVVSFPFPDAAHRAEIWKRVFPGETPTEGLDMNKLARLNIAGGNIRNIALNAAFLAADDGGPVRMEHLLRAARTEYIKMDKALSSAEIGGWA